MSDETALVRVEQHLATREEPSFTVERRAIERRKDTTPADPTMVRSMNVMAEKLNGALDKLEQKANSMDSSTRKIVIITTGVLLTCAMIVGAQIYSIRQNIKLEAWRQTSRGIITKNNAGIEEVKKQNEELLHELEELRKEQQKP